MSHSKSPQDKQEQEEDSPRANWLGVTIGVTSLYRQKSWFWFSSQTSTTCREMGTGPLVRVFSLYSSNNKQIQLVLHDNNNAQCICESSWWNIFSIFLKLGVGDTLKLTHQRPDSTSVISVRWFPPPLLLYILARQLHVNNRNYFFSLFFFRPLHSIMHYTSVLRIYIFIYQRERDMKCTGGWVYIYIESKSTTTLCNNTSLFLK